VSPTDQPLKKSTHRKDAKNAKKFNSKEIIEITEHVIPAKAGIQYLTDAAKTRFPLSRE
jgi:hypothetical protein